MKLAKLAVAISLAFSSAHAQNWEFSQSIRLKQTGIDQAWARNQRGQGSVIGIIDQGFDVNHTDLKGQVLGALNFAGSGPVTAGLHGTGMASIAAGSANNQGTVGVAPAAKLLLAQVGLGGTNTAMNATAVNRALDWLSLSKAHVINISFGGEYTNAFIQSTRYDAKSKTYIGSNVASNLPAFAQAAARGSILVMAAGNQALPYSQAPAVFASHVQSNGSLSLLGRAIIVGSVDANNQISSFSNRAGHLCQTVIMGTCRDKELAMNYFVVAPGEKLYAAAPGQLVTAVSGTSGATALVSGGMALMRQAWPHLKPEQLVGLVLTTTKDLGAPGVDPIYGRGLVDFGKATAPTGQLMIPAMSQRLGTGTVSGQSVAMTGISSDLAFTLRSTSLATSQVVDQIGRNYTADLTQLSFKNNMGYDPVSPYMTMTAYQPAVMVIDTARVSVYTAQQAQAIQIGKDFGTAHLSYQFGTRQQSHGFAGNWGTGAFDLGNSSTNWHIIGTEIKVSHNTRLLASYGQGLSRINSVPSSMIQITAPVQTETWQFGLQKDHVMSSKDQLQFGLAGDIRIKSGKAMITTVQGYDYLENEHGDIIAHPQTVKELVNLRQQHQPVLWSNYRIALMPNTFLTASAVANQNSYRAGVQFTWIQ